jgi:hypothetical protein
MFTLLIEHCQVLSFSVGALVPILLGWFRLRTRSFYREASERAQNSEGARIKLLAIAAVDQVGVLIAVISFPELLR